MTYGPDGPGPNEPQYPYSYEWSPGHTQSYPLLQTSKMATWSIVFAFVFAPIGAVLGHFALANIRDYHQRGRDRAVLGLMLSYTFIVIAVGALVVWSITPTRPLLSATAPIKVTLTPPPMPTPSFSAPSTKPRPNTPLVTPTDLPQLLLTIDDVKAIMDTPKLTQTMGTPPLRPRPDSPPGAPSGEATTNPPECVGAVLNGIDTVYASSGAQGFQQAGFADPSTGTFVGESVFALANADSAQRFVSKMVDQWRGCAGKRVTFSTPGQPTLNWTVGTVTTLGDRITLNNVIAAARSEPQVRIVAAKNNVIVDLNVFSRTLADQPAIIADQILAKVPG